MSITTLSVSQSVCLFVFGVNKWSFSLVCLSLPGGKFALRDRKRKMYETEVVVEEKDLTETATDLAIKDLSSFIWLQDTV